MNMENRSIY